MSHRRHVSIGSLGSASLGLLAASITLHAAGCGLSGDDLYSTAGMCPDASNDRNPCTLDGCAQGGLTFTHDAVSNGSACALGQNAGVCVAGLCVLGCAGSPSDCKCADPLQDCPTATECLGWKCDGDHHCAADPRTGTALSEAEQTPKDCKKMVCTEAGGATSVNDDDDRPDDSVCMLGACFDGAPTNVARPVGDPCGGGQMGVCDGSQSCAPCVENLTAGCGPGEVCKRPMGGVLQCGLPHCFDNVPDLGETGLDCGGTCKQPCGLGSGCSKSSDCSNNVCAAGNAPGVNVCCESLCAGACRFCAQGSGACEDMPTGSSDVACTVDQLCEQGAGCVTKLWSPCTGDSECMSGHCHDTGNGKQCFPGAAGAACSSDSGCMSHKCDVNGAMSCLPGGLGDPCVNDADCVNTICSSMTMTCK
jgi:hypothetical protein